MKLVLALLVAALVAGAVYSPPVAGAAGADVAKKCKKGWKKVHGRCKRPKSKPSSVARTYTVVGITGNRVTVIRARA